VQDVCWLDTARGAAAAAAEANYRRHIHNNNQNEIKGRCVPHFISPGKKLQQQQPQKYFFLNIEKDSGKKIICIRTTRRQITNLIISLLCV
jgi:hypothetical protein